MSAATRWPYALLALDPTIVTPSPGNPANDPPRTYNANGEHEPRTPRACAPSKAANAAAGHSASPGPISRAPTAAAAARSASARRTASAADTSCIRAAVADNTDRGACPVSTPRHACTAPTRSTNSATAAADGGSHTRNNPARARATSTSSPATSTTDCSLTSTPHSHRLPTHIDSPQRSANAVARSPVDGRSRPAKSAVVNANRNTRSNPRPVNRPVRTARSNKSDSRRSGRHDRRTTAPGTSAAHRHGVPRHRCADRSLAANTRSNTTTEDSPGSPENANVAGSNAARSTRISTRSINGPDNRPKYRRRTPAAQVQSTSLAAAHGHGFAAKIN